MKDTRLPVYDTDILNWLEDHATHREYWAEVKLFEDFGGVVIRLATQAHSEDCEDIDSDIFRLVAYFDLEMRDYAYDDQSANTMFNGTYVYIYLTPESRTVTR